MVTVHDATGLSLAVAHAAGLPPPGRISPAA